MPKAFFLVFLALGALCDVLS